MWWPPSSPKVIRNWAERMMFLGRQIFWGYLSLGGDELVIIRYSLACVQFLQVSVLQHQRCNHNSNWLWLGQNYGPVFQHLQTKVHDFRPQCETLQFAKPFPDLQHLVTLWRHLQLTNYCMTYFTIYCQSRCPIFGTLCSNGLSR